jgi:opacity protein-like surface antigen
MNAAPRVMLVALGLAAIVSTASAQMDNLESNRIISVGLGGGVSVPVSDAKDAFKNGFNGQGFVRLNLKFLPIRPRVDFSFQRFDLKDAQVSGGPSTPIDGHGQVLAGLGSIQLDLLRGPIRPYIVAGVGAYQLKTTVEGTGGTETSTTKFGVNGGGGLVVRLGKLCSLYAEGRVDNVFTDQGVIAADQIQLVPVTFGVVF